MYAVEKLSSYITRGVYTVSGPFHPFGGAVDIIVVQQQDGSFKSSPWYVRFGKFQGVLKTREKVVAICVNGVEAGFHMYLDHKGEAFFLTDADSGEPLDLESSPSSSSSSSSGDELDDKVKSAGFEDQGEAAVTPQDNGDKKIVARTRSRRSRLFGLVFGGKSTPGSDQGPTVDRVSSLERAEIAADLLETKWSTNLSKNESVTNNKHLEKGEDEDETVSSREEATGDNFDVSVVSRENLEEAAVHGSLDDAANQAGDESNACLSTVDSVKESFGSDDEKLGDGHHPSVVRELHFEEAVNQTSTSTIHEEVFKVQTLEIGDSGETRLLSETVVIESDAYNETSGTSLHESIVYDTRVATSEVDEPRQVALLGEEEKEVTSVSYKADISEVTSGLESSIDRENCSLELSHADICSVFQECQSNSPSNLTFWELPGNVSNSSSPQKLSSFQSEVIHEDRGSAELSHVELNRAEENDFLQIQSPDLEEKASLPNSHVREPSHVSFSSNSCEESRNSGYQSRQICAQDESEFPLSESFEDEQFQFSDLGSFSVREINSGVQTRSSGAEMDDNTLFEVESDVEEEHDSEDRNHEECIERDSEVSGSQTSPLAIPRSIIHSGENEQSAKSLPIIRSQIHDLERSNHLHSLSCSLDLNSDSFEQDFQKQETSNSFKLDLDSLTEAMQGNGQSSFLTVDSGNKQDHSEVPINSSVELSLCKHLLFEGMGADAASSIFEVNKVNLEKFSTLGPSLLKNDKLVVRIRGRYFPWSAAAPIILGMLCFGQEQLFDSQGMIDVEKHAGPPSGGSWRLWPFSLKRSKTINTERSGPEDTTQENLRSPMRSLSLNDHVDIQKAKYLKKKVQSLTPSSEELASLNLREGRNIVTFCFSTAMLGQQQVDARIYLWKWNTRIVISDVDGTITKSDVLGQFMPLVGKDWSQTGVTHLFSAIKENGYQFLFLSARAISQAYLTRQFLFNLKQDGKALPDGPVVISPDGLFPSLYREVIRRAPHEFKISCLEDIRALFPPECNPFYAGFGNRDTDEISYLKVGVPKGKIFIVNPKGEVAVNHRVNTKSYTSLHALVNGMFPPTSTAEQEDFNSWNYWRLPLPDVDL